MNTFDKGRLKYEKNRERKERWMANSPVQTSEFGSLPPSIPVVVPVETPVKNKFPNASTVSVTVNVRGEAFSMVFDVPGMQGNLPASAFNQSAMTELIKAALTSKLGKVNVCNLP